MCTQVSVLIPFKNEKDNLPALINALKAQDYSADKVEYFFINDASTDGGEDLLSAFTVLSNAGQGKKAALKTALQAAAGELIITLDADCLVGEKWLSSIVAFYEEERADLITCPVNIAPVKTIWEKLQAIEFQSLAASTGGAALGGQAIMCNGANLAFKKSLTEGDADFFNEKYASGDDMFLLEHAKRSKAKVAYLKCRDSIATTAPETWQAFWRQRSRWTSKSAGYRDVAIILCGLIVLSANLSLLALPFISGFYLLVALGLKMLVDFLLLNVSSAFFKTSDFLWLYFLILPFYPFYVLYAVLRGMLVKRW